MLVRVGSPGVSTALDGDAADSGAGRLSSSFRCFWGEGKKVAAGVVAGHHVRMKTITPCRCVECNAVFVPDPRVGDRQVTCGAAECQRARHAKRCQVWHGSNKEIAAGHYQDVVVPFRTEQPDYQRRWRWSRRLREIREKTTWMGAVVLAGLRELVRRAEQMVQQAMGVVQTGVLAVEKLRRAVGVLGTMITSLERLEASTAELGDLGQ